VWDTASGAVSGAGLIAGYCCAGAYSTTYANRAVANGKHYWELILSVRVGERHPDTWTNAGVDAGTSALGQTERRAPPVMPNALGSAIERGRTTQFVNGDVFMFALDASKGVLYRGVNGQWRNGDPAEENGGDAIGQPGNSYRAYVNVSASSKQTGPEGDRWIANFGGKSFKYALPTGYSSYGISSSPSEFNARGAPTSIAIAATPASSESPVGKSFRGQMSIGGQAVPLPSGDWTGVAFFRGGSASTRGDAAILARIENGRINGLVGVNANTFANDQRGAIQPFASCERQDYVFRKTLVNEAGGEQRCWWINHATGVWQDQGIFRAAREELLQKKLVLPEVMVNVAFRRARANSFVTAFYYFDPALEGISSAPLIWSASEWHKDRISSDPARMRYVQRLQKWGDDWAPVFFATR
jgi:hypothetical protein